MRGRNNKFMSFKRERPQRSIIEKSELSEEEMDDGKCDEKDFDEKIVPTKNYTLSQRQKPV